MPRVTGSACGSDPGRNHGRERDSERRRRRRAPPPNRHHLTEANGGPAGSPLPKFVTVTYGFSALEAGDGHAGDADSVGELVLVEALFLACAPEVFAEFGRSVHQRNCMIYSLIIRFIWT